MAKQQENVKDAFLKEINELANESSLHGVKYVAKFKDTRPKQICWGLLVAMCLASVVTTIWLNVVSYYKYESVINFEYDTPSALDLPSITVCNRNYYRKSLIERDFSDIADMLKEMTYSWFSIPTDDNVTMNYTLLNQYGYWDIVDNASHTLDDTFIQCRVASWLLNCSDYVTKHLTTSGICYTFNSYHYFRENGRLQVSAPGKDNSLSLLLDTQSHDYHGPAGFGAGFSVLLHDVSVFPRLDLKPFSIGAGHSVEVAVSSERYDVLPRPYSRDDCVATPRRYDATYTDGYPYSSDACKFSCLCALIEAHCGCVMYSRQPQNMCYYWHFVTCVDELGVTMDNAPCDCTPLCDYTDYQLQISSTDYPNVMAVDNARRNNLSVTSRDELRARHVELQVYFSSLTVTEVKQNRKYEVWDIISSVGGTMGLFLGMSLLSVVEFLDYMLSFVVKVTKTRSNTELKVMPSGGEHVNVSDGHFIGKVKVSDYDTVKDAAEHGGKPWSGGYDNNEQLFTKIDHLFLRPPSEWGTISASET